MSEKYVYHGMDITLDVYEKISTVAAMIGEKDCVTFEEAYQRFAASKTYEALQNPDTLMWSESAEYVVDGYYREKT